MIINVIQEIKKLTPLHTGCSDQSFNIKLIAKFAVKKDMNIPQVK